MAKANFPTSRKNRKARPVPTQAIARKSIALAQREMEWPEIAQRRRNMASALRIVLTEDFIYPPVSHDDDSNQQRIYWAASCRLQVHEIADRLSADDVIALAQLGKLLLTCPIDEGTRAAIDAIKERLWPSREASHAA